jgi:hypothetical protein
VNDAQNAARFGSSLSRGFILESIAQCAVIRVIRLARALDVHHLQKLPIE